MGRSSPGYGTGYNYLARGIVMTQSAVAGAGTSAGTEFGADNLVANATAYKAHAGIVNAASRYDNLDDAIKSLRETWAMFEAQVEDGGGFTPEASLGFGSDNAAVIAETILGIRNTVGTTRKQLKALGK